MTEKVWLVFLHGLATMDSKKDGTAMTAQITDTESYRDLQQS
jgi:hypothetical protein